MAGTEVELRTGGALAISGEQTEWTEQQLAVLRSAGVNEEVTAAELSAFLHECQRTKLDPFTRQIYLIGRYDNQAKRKVFRSQTGIDGYRVIANRVVREEAADLEYEDTLWCGPDRVWRDVWLAENPPAAAKVVVLKNGKRFPAVATLAEYAARYPDGNPYPMWKRMPSNQLAKCAEALALRKAFPQDLAGIYTAEEMEQADARAEVHQLTPEDAADAVVRKAERERAQRTAPNGPHDDEFTIAPAPAQASEAQRTKLILLMKDKLGVTERDKRIAMMSKHLGRTISTFNEITASEATSTIDALSKLKDHIDDAEVVDDPPAPQAPTDIGDAVGAAHAAADLYSELYRRIEQADIDGLDAAVNAAIEARDAGLIIAGQWTVLSNLANGRSAQLVQDAAAGAGWSHQMLAERGLSLDAAPAVPA
jgi:phage recombination protein Bet